MTGTVIRIRKRGVEARMVEDTEPAGEFEIVQGDAAVGPLVLRKKTGERTFNFNWTGEPPNVEVGSTIRSR